jgi:hypothetical protein
MRLNHDSLVTSVKLSFDMATSFLFLLNFC